MRQSYIKGSTLRTPYLIATSQIHIWATGGTLLWKRILFPVCHHFHKDPWNDKFTQTCASSDGSSQNNKYRESQFSITISHSFKFIKRFCRNIVLHSQNNTKLPTWLQHILPRRLQHQFLWRSASVSQQKWLIWSHPLHFFKTRGPTLSPVALLCLTWVPSQRGNVPDRQHLPTHHPT